MTDSTVLLALYVALAVVIAALVTAWPNQGASGATAEPVKHDDFNCVRLREVRPGQKHFLLCSMGVTYREV